MRSKLFVPGSRPELFGKALRGEADALSFDLEDSVSPGRKAEARAALQDLLSGPVARESGKTLIARVNPCGSEHFEADVQAVVRPGLSLLNLPKVESVSEVFAAVQALEAAERANGVVEPVRLLLNIDSARGLRLACTLASAHARVAGLQLGLGDLFEPLTSRVSAPRPRWRAAWATRARAASTPARSRMPTSCSARPTTRLPTPSAWSPRPTRPRRAAWARTRSTATWSTRPS